MFERDVFKVTLTGKLHLIHAIGDKTSGAVFLGNGSFELRPASEAERRQVGMHMADPRLVTLGDSFESVIFLGTALTAAAEKAGAPVTGPVDPKASDRWDDYLKKQKRDLHTNMQIRLLQELIDDREPFFLAWVDGKKLPPSVLIVDPRGAESVRLAGREMGGEQSMMYVSHSERGGIWYSARLRSEIQAGRGVKIVPPAEAEHYQIDSTIRGEEMSGTTTITLVPSAPVRVLPIEIAGKLRLSEVSYASAAEPSNWTPVAVIQEHEKEDPDAAVIFPVAVTAGQQYLLKLVYAGRDVLENSGDGNWTITRRVNWYPNVGTFRDLATYDLRFRTPAKFQIVSVGEEVENRMEGDDRITVWKSTHPLRVAGFNYGRFKKLSQTDKDSGMTFEVYTNPGTPDVINQINRALEEHSRVAGGPSFVRVDTGSLAQAAMADGINTARTGNVYFGPLAHRRVAITQQSQWFFGQSWPTLVYLPYVAFLDGTVRNTLGLNDVKEFVDTVGPHELAHQWWGHQVGWASYRDEWISEGFSEFTTAAVLQQTGGWPKYNDFFELARRRILEKPRGALVTNAEAGPISQGNRIGSSQNQSAYGAIIYSKGAYVLHMLRMTMRDTKNGDAAFMAMMTDFATAYAGKNASTADFQRIVEKHATRSLKLTQDGKLDWFFNQWVHGTDIPRYTSKLDFTDAGGGKYKVTGTITQSDVPEGFAVVMPIYVHFDKSSYMHLASTALIGNQTKPVEIEIALPKKPLKFTINANHDVLAR
ncbi:MAG TPA: M1 family aminopeptidase [Thermoanaerobaculia bacterium]